MELFTLDRSYNKQDVIDGFQSVIWTERYFGNGDFELVVPATHDMISKLSLGKFLSIAESDQIMIIETSNNIEGGLLKITGMSLLPWMNNRFIRISPLHQERYWYIDGYPAGRILWFILAIMCTGGVWQSGVPDMGLPSNPNSFLYQSQLVIPGLGLKSFDQSGPSIKIAVPYGPVYDAMLDIATTYDIGMKIAYEPDPYWPIKFQSYKGLDRTSSQSVNPIVKFSGRLDSLINITELQSIAALKTLAFVFAPELSSEQLPVGSRAGLAGNAPQSTGFDLRAIMVFADDITTDSFGASASNLNNILDSRAKAALAENPFVKAVDGEIVPSNQYVYGSDYNLGDIIEVEGNSGMIQKARATEYIRSQDENGERSYPTLVSYE